MGYDVLCTANVIIENGQGFRTVNQLGMLALAGPLRQVRHDDSPQDFLQATATPTINKHQPHCTSYPACIARSHTTNRQNHAATMQLACNLTLNRGQQVKQQQSAQR